MKVGPAVCQGRIPVVLHLCAPNGRAVQVTRDLPGFWREHYPGIRRELCRRYPRHPWPEDGATAVPPRPAAAPPRRHRRLARASYMRPRSFDQSDAQVFVPAGLKLRQRVRGRERTRRS